MLDAGKGYSDIPYDVLNGMDRAGRDALVAYARAGGKVTTDPVAFYRLQDLALDHPQAFLDADLNDHIDKLDGQDLARLTALQATLREKGADDPQIGLLRGYKANTDRMLRQLGLLPASGASEGGAAGTADHGTGDQGGGSDDLAARIAAKFRQTVDMNLRAQEAATGRKATPVEQQQIVDQAAINLRRIQAEHEARPINAVYTESGTSAGSGNPLLVRTAGGDVQMADATNGQGEQVSQGEATDGTSTEAGASGDNSATRGLETLIAGPEAPIAPWLKPDAREIFGGILPFPDGNATQAHKGERKTMGPLAKQAEEAIWTLKPATIWPIAEEPKINLRNGATADGYYTYGARKELSGKDKAHEGIDIAAEVGTRVNAVKDGKVVWVSDEMYPGAKLNSDFYRNHPGRVPKEDAGYGNQVIIQHDDGTFTVYAHLQDVTYVKGGRPFRQSFVKVGDTVRAGDQVGQVGATGNLPVGGQSHLHFEVRYKSEGRGKTTRTTINPLYYLPWLGSAIYGRK